MRRTPSDPSRLSSRAATLNGCHGFGYATLDRQDAGNVVWRGSIAVDSSVAVPLLQAARERCSLTYSGVVYDGSLERFVTLGVAVERVRDDGAGCVIDFSTQRS